MRDIAYHIDLANQFVAGFDCETFTNDLRTLYAVTRCLEIISEASRRLPPELKQRHPAIAFGDFIFVSSWPGLTRPSTQRSRTEFDPLKPHFEFSGRATPWMAGPSPAMTME